ncbi:hypothetical protein PR048_007030 [Dryococelus australis]|uniref:Uncharacterized protein n=1 Tax=Dryococelus australis TaxID=614101 RepID=A0ABQ9ICI4_9NEOP|nr:hypothetical protein PR048_007030 [Dryococelus australis]
MGTYTYLRHCYYLFKNVPARTDHIRITWSELFPKKFCAIRWPENVEVAEHTIKILPHLKKFLQEESVSSVSFNIVKSALVNNLLEVKFTFFNSFASELELFLTIFQSETPMAPFLCDSLEDILLALVEKNLGNQSFKEKWNVSRLDLDQQENLLTANNIRLSDCKRTLNPLKYKLTKGISSLCPSVALDKEPWKQRLKLSIECCLQNRWLSGTDVDIIEQAYELVCSSTDSKALLPYFSREGRLHHLWLPKVSERDVGTFPWKCHFRMRIFTKL